ncbi:putative disease resistance protein At1g50180 [Lycium barbarum]|uniref:putative disease resistance protein At1g50180 n=1 Tax=Lycium barbarum TaxID=112863 RepID=UPI00293E9F39|nr:putative disease resistance protein At1g50180 [Lycium barbarum]
MAEAAVSYVAERLIDLFQRKIVFLKNVQQEVEGVRNELIRMKCFLKDADMKQEEDKDARIRNWVSEIRAVAYHAEDVIEIFIHQVESFERQSFFIKCAFYPKKLYLLYKVGKEIESIQTKILEISNSRERYGIRHIQGLGDGEGSSTARKRMRELRRSSPLVANKDAVGLEKHVNSVVSILLKEDKRLHVASIVGMGGIGKTTLAKEVYNQAQIRGKFDNRAWVYVSQDYKPTKIIKELILQLANPEEDKVKIVDTMDKLSEAALEEMLHRRLEKTCYLIVLDDIWTTEAWDIIARSFPNNDKSSRLLLTSRRKEVALHADAHTTPYELKVLSEEESWELFIKKAFAEERECPQDLVDVGKEILKKCDGLPLAITVIGGLLAGKKKQRSEWQRVQRSLSSYLVGSQAYGVSAILALSYHELPPHLKSCFLYLGLLQKGKDIPVKQLMHIWIAHGLIQQKGEQKLEDIAEDFLDELIGRNLVRVNLVKADDKVKSCRLHDLLRDFCIMKAKEEIFLEVHQKADDLSISVSESRHHVFQCPPDRYKYLGNSKSYIRSLLSFDSSAKPVNLDCICTSSFKLLKVLYIDSPGLKVISESIGKLCSLKYLGIGWRTRIKKLPRSISRLKNLETIDMPMSRYYSVLVPNVLWKLENLKHLLGYIESRSLLKIDLLNNLQTLGSIPVHHWMHNENLTRMTNLQKVGLLIESVDNLDVDRLCDSLAELESLQSLCLEVEYSLQISMFAGLSKLTHVVKLKFKGKLASMPAHPCVFPPNLCQLTLVDSQLHPDSIQVLEKLTNLSTLKLVNAFDLQDYSITISENGFRGLKFLRVEQLMFMQEMKLGKGAMAGLKCLQIFKCYSLRRLPEELISLTNLDKLEIRGMSEEFIARLQLSDLCKLQHIPNIVVGSTDDDEWIQEELERASLIRKIRTHAQVIRAAVLFQAASERSPNVNTD